MQIKITINSAGNPPGKVADAEIHFDSLCGPLEGLKLIGFGVWERPTFRAGFNVTFPARQYSINGERRSFALLRPIQDTTAQAAIQDAIIAAYRIAAGLDLDPEAIAPATTTSASQHIAQCDAAAARAALDSTNTTKPNDDLPF